MTDTLSPGQIAYEAWRAMQRSGWLYEAPLPWTNLDTSTHAAWEAAAQAVLAMQLSFHRWTPQPLHVADEETMPRFPFALGQHVRRTSDPAHRWEIWYRAYREERDRVFIDYGLRLVDPEADYHPCRMSDGSDLTLAEDEDG